MTSSKDPYSYPNKFMEMISMYVYIQEMLDYIIEM